MTDEDRHHREVIALEKVLLKALGRTWAPSGFSLETLVHDAASEIEKLRDAARALLRQPAVPTGTDEWHILARLVGVSPDERR